MKLSSTMYKRKVFKCNNVVFCSILSIICFVNKSTRDKNTLEEISVPLASPFKSPSQHSGSSDGNAASLNLRKADNVQKIVKSYNGTLTLICTGQVQVQKV